MEGDSCDLIVLSITRAGEGDAANETIEFRLDTKMVLPVSARTRAAGVVKLVLGKTCCGGGTQLATAGEAGGKEEARVCEHGSVALSSFQCNRQTGNHGIIEASAIGLGPSP